MNSLLLHIDDKKVFEAQLNQYFTEFLINQNGDIYTVDIDAMDIEVAITALISFVLQVASIDDSKITKAIYKAHQKSFQAFILPKENKDFSTTISLQDIWDYINTLISINWNEDDTLKNTSQTYYSFFKQEYSVRVPSLPFSSIDSSDDDGVYYHFSKNFDFKKHQQRIDLIDTHLEDYNPHNWEEISYGEAESLIENLLHQNIDREGVTSHNIKLSKARQKAQAFMTTLPKDIYFYTNVESVHNPYKEHGDTMFDDYWASGFKSAWFAFVTKRCLIVGSRAWDFWSE